MSATPLALTPAVHRRNSGNCAGKTVFWPTQEAKNTVFLFAKCRV